MLKKIYKNVYKYFKIKWDKEMENSESRQAVEKVQGWWRKSFFGKIIVILGFISVSGMILISSIILTKLAIRIIDKFGFLIFILGMIVFGIITEILSKLSDKFLEKRKSE